MAINFKRLYTSIKIVDYKSVTSLWFRTIAICVDTLNHFIHGSFADGESIKMIRAFYGTQVILLTQLFKSFCRDRYTNSSEPTCSGRLEERS
jgi:hypothetical protein